MKTTCLVLKILACVLVVAASVCAIIAYWDKLVEFGLSVRNKLCSAREIVCKSEFEDYAE